MADENSESVKADENSEYIERVIKDGSAEGKLALAEELLSKDCPEQAQSVLDSVIERQGKWHFLQSKVFLHKNWIYESRKQMEIATALEPENEFYKEELEKLNAMGDTPPRLDEEGEKPEMDKGSCKQACAEMSVYACCSCVCEGLCEALCEGCG